MRKDVLLEYAVCNEMKGGMMGRVNLMINGQEIQSWQGATILESALENKIYIPHLCYHPDLKPQGACRVCLVELDNGQFVASCKTPVKEGMVLETNSPELDRVRRPIIEMIIANHHMDCRNCLKKGQCQLQKIMAYIKIDKQTIQQHMRLSLREILVDDSNPFFIRDHNKCVMCGICVSTCREIVKINAIDFVGRGNKLKIATFGDSEIANSKCISCGECVIRCPVGALAFKDTRKPTKEVKSVCPYCGVGCDIYLGIKDNQIVKVRADKSSSVNFGSLCVKGRFGMEFVHSPDRLKDPLIRHGKGKTEKVSWDEALDLIAKNLSKYKNEEFALIASTKCTNEDNYIAQKFARVIMGSNNIDTMARFCYAPAISAFRRTGQCVGFGLNQEDNPCFSPQIEHTLNKIEKVSCVLIAGANMTRSFPVLALKIKRAVDSGAKLIIISPNETELCINADKWLKPYPGTDLALLMGMCNVIVEEELYDKSFAEMYCNNFDEFREILGDFPLGRVERITGVPRALIEETARLYAVSYPAAIFWGSGITQHTNGTDNVHALINLAILTANIKHSFSLNPLSGQSNSLGACDMGCLPDYYPCYQPVTSSDVRETFESLWDCKLNPNPGLTISEIIDATIAGKIKALYIIGTDLTTSFVPAKKVATALKKAKFVVFQDMFLNDTAKYANVILPAASFAEKEGIIINTEGKTQKIERALEPLGNSRPDWSIICELAKRFEHQGFVFGSAEEILSEIFTVIQHLPERIGKFNLFPLQYTHPAETADIDYPIILITERDIYNYGVLSEKVEGLKILKSKNYIYINPKDADDFGVSDMEEIRIISRHGSIQAEARLSKSTPTGLAVMNLEKGKFNPLLNPILNGISKTPEIKMCAIRFEKIKASKKRQIPMNIGIQRVMHDD